MHRDHEEEEEVMEGAEGEFKLASPQSSTGGSPKSSHAAEDVGAEGPPAPSPVAHRSGAWDHFEVVVEDPTHVVCNHCRMRISRGKDMKHPTTTSILTHLRRHHPLQLGIPPQAGSRSSKVGKAPAPRPASGRPQRHSTLEEWGKGRGRGGNKVPTVREVTQRIGEMLALDDQPFPMVEQEGFRHLMALVAPYYTIPSCTTFSQTVVPSLYQGCREHVERLLDGAGRASIHFTMDIWTSHGEGHAYLSLTGHWWESEGTMGSGHRWALLHAEVLDVAHMSAEIQGAINRMVEGWLSGRQQLTRGFMVTDCEANMVKAVRDAGFEGIQCLAHRVHLIVQDSLGQGATSGEAVPSSIHSLSLLIERCWRIAAYLHHSVKGGRVLWEKQVRECLPQHRLLQDVPTRWNSTLLMLRQLAEQQAAIHTAPLVVEIGGIATAPSKREWETINQLVCVLQPFLEATDKTSVSTALLSQVIPLVLALRHRLEGMEADGTLAGLAGPLLPEVRVLVTRLREGVRRHLEPLLQNRTYVLAGMCDPRLKKGACGQGTLGEWKEELLSKVREAYRRRVGEAEGAGALATPYASTRTTASSTQGTPSSTASGEAGGKQQQQPPDLWDIGLSLAIGEEETLPQTTDTTEGSISSYLTEPLEPRSCDPLAYWASRSQMWEDLATVAREHLSCPPTSVPSERVFSMAGNVVTPHRTSLDPALVEQLVFLKVNLPLLGFPRLDPKVE